MDPAQQSKYPPLTRAECSEIVDRLNSESGLPAYNDVVRLAEYAYLHKPEGMHDWARADVFEFLKLRAAEFDPALKEKALGLIVAAMLNDIQDADTRQNLTAPGTIGEAVQLTFFAGDPTALRMVHSAVEYPFRLPGTFYHAFGYDLAVVLREVSKVPRGESFMRALAELGAFSHQIVNVELDDVTKPDTEDNFDSNYGRAAQFGSPITHYGMKRDLTPNQAWQSASFNSQFERKLVHVKFIEIAEACGLEVAPKPPAKVEWFADLRFPFIHFRTVKSDSADPPKFQESPGKGGQP